MAWLFKKKLLKQKLDGYTIPNFEKKLALIQQRYDAQTKWILTKKTETECEQAFNDDIFKQVLGYTSFPSSPFTIDPKGKTQATGQKPDAILWYYDPEKENSHSKTQVVVEIKDAKTPLDKSQRREWNLSPIQQWFKYKPQYSNCKWVIATNFIEIRLFKDNQLDYEIWTLEDLVNPENDYYQFKRFYYLLNADNLISKSGTSRTEKLLSEVRIEQEQITKKFYKEYKQLRLELINDMRTNNPDVDLETVIEKAQKVIDRLIFVHFCEDLELLPENKLAEVVAYAENLVGVPVWQILQGFFEAVNSWSAKLKIPDGYNGWLFHEDKELNALKIGNAICYKFVDIGVYDFAEDLSVNILWHIFEQSISDLEELKIDLLWTVLETWELGENTTKTSKRKKDGIFYTPEYIVDYIVKNSLWTWLEEQFEILKKTKFKQSKKMKDETFVAKEKELYVAYQQILQNVKVLDPACGSGAFLVKVFDYLLEENVRVMNVLSDGQEWLFDLYDMAKGILTNNIYGVDLNAESVEITKLSLWLKTAQKGKKLADLNNNIKCGNSLIDDPEVAGEKAFKWEEQFADIMGAWGFDLVVGNPPYVNIDKISEKPFLKNQYKIIDGFTDIYYIFLYLGTRILQKWWLLWFIVPSYFFTALYAKNLREYLVKNTHTQEIIDFKAKHIFADAGVHTCIIIYENEGASKDTYYKKDLDDNPSLVTLPLDWSSRTFTTKAEKLLESKLYKWSQPIEEIGDVVKSMETWKNAVFSITQEVTQKYKIENEVLKSFVKNGHIQKYAILPNDKKIIRTHWIDIEQYPQTKKYLEEYKNELEARYDIKSRKAPRYDISNPRWVDFFIENNEKIIVPYMAKNNQFYFDKSWLLNDWWDIRAIFLNNKNYYYLYVLAICNSSLLNWFHKKNAKLKGSVYEYFNNVLNRYPIKTVSLDNQKPFVEKADAMLSLNKEFYEALQIALDLLASKYWLKKISKKLQAFYELEFQEFKKQLKIKKLSLEDEEELLSYFTKKKTQLLELKAKIDATDREIDEMVFDLYELTDEERKVVLDC